MMGKKVDLKYYENSQRNVRHKSLKNAEVPFGIFKCSYDVYYYNTFRKLYFNIFTKKLKYEYFSVNIYF